MICSKRLCGVITASLTFSVEVSSFGRMQRFALPVRSLNTIAKPAISTSSIGTLGNIDYRMKYFSDGKQISPWHDIPHKDELSQYNFITEIPRYYRHKMEIAGKEPFNPIAQDIKNDKPRFYHGPIFWNYGCIPQTWEDPNVQDSETRTFGDNDPIDVVEIGSRTLPMGSVTKIKVLGALAMVDSGELDWKIIAINTDDPMCAVLNDQADVEKHMPGVISGIREWFRWYKTPDGKTLNMFGYGEKCIDASHASHVIEETHASWANLVTGKVQDEKGLWTNQK